MSISRLLCDGASRYKHTTTARHGSGEKPPTCCVDPKRPFRGGLRSRGLIFERRARQKNPATQIGRQKKPAAAQKAVKNVRFSDEAVL